MQETQNLILIKYLLSSLNFRDSIKFNRPTCLIVCCKTLLGPASLFCVIFSAVCHAILAGNASSELSCIDNIKDHVSHQSPPVITSLINR